MNTTNDLRIKDLIREVNRFRRTEIAKQNQRNFERQIELENGTQYELEIYFKDGKSPEFISLEGYKNGFGILEAYRKIGFSLNVRKLVLTLDNKKVKSINFKY